MASGRTRGNTHGGRAPSEGVRRSKNGDRSLPPGIPGGARRTLWEGPPYGTLLRKEENCRSGQKGTCSSWDNASGPDRCRWRRSRRTSPERRGARPKTTENANDCTRNLILSKEVYLGNIKKFIKRPNKRLSPSQSPRPDKVVVRRTPHGSRGCPEGLLVLESSLYGTSDRDPNTPPQTTLVSYLGPDDGTRPDPHRPIGPCTASPLVRTGERQKITNPKMTCKD